jgi:hypothetical protein
VAADFDTEFAKGFLVLTKPSWGDVSLASGQVGCDLKSNISAIGK